MKVKSERDLWAGLMFIGFGLFFAIWALTHYQMGTAVRMGPAYFPTMLGGLLVFLGALVLLEAVTMGNPDEEKVRVPFGFLDMVVLIAIYAAAGYLARWLGFSSDWAILGATVVVTALTVLRRPAAKPLILISAACVAYGYLMKPLGLVLATGAMVFVAAFGGHEFRWKEVAVLYVALIVFSVLVFVKGLTLPFPLWPAVLGY